MIRSRQVVCGIAALAWAGGLSGQRSTTHAQQGDRVCAPPLVIPSTAAEPAPRLVVNAPLAEPLSARGVVVITYCAENMRLAPVFGAGALAASPRIGHVHVTVDNAPWHWADASGTPIILRSLPPGPHLVKVDLVDANHQRVDTDTVAFTVPVDGTGRPTP